LYEPNCVTIAMDIELPTVHLVLAGSEKRLRLTFQRFSQQGLSTGRSPGQHRGTSLPPDLAREMGCNSNGLRASPLNGSPPLAFILFSSGRTP
jgi:hypothetical protein